MIPKNDKETLNDQNNANINKKRRDYVYKNTQNYFKKTLKDSSFALMLNG